MYFMMLLQGLVNLPHFIVKIDAGLIKGIILLSLIVKSLINLNLVIFELSELVLILFGLDLPLVVLALLASGKGFT
jgi:hypothetical protein